jgi:hypothetical protein
MLSLIISIKIRTNVIEYLLYFLYDDRLLKVQKNADALYSSSVLSSNVNAIFVLPLEAKKSLKIPNRASLT